MNKLILSALFILSSITLTVYSSILYVQNNYRKPIQLKINGQVMQGTFIKTGERVRTIDVNHLQSLAIKTTESLQYKNLDNEISSIKSQASSHSGQDVILTIPNTNNILYWKPGIIEWKTNPGQQILIPDPTKNFIEERISPREMLNILHNYPYSYGIDCAQQIQYILRYRPDRIGQLEVNINAARLLEKHDSKKSPFGGPSIQKTKAGIMKAIDTMYNNLTNSQFR